MIDTVTYIKTTIEESHMTPILDPVFFAYAIDQRFLIAFFFVFIPYLLRDLKASAMDIIIVFAHCKNISFFNLPITCSDSREQELVFFHYYLSPSIFIDKA